MGCKGSNQTKHESKYFGTNHAVMTVDTMTKLKTCVEETIKGQPSACGRSPSENVDVGSCILALALAMFMLQRKSFTTYEVNFQDGYTLTSNKYDVTSHVFLNLYLLLLHTA